MDTIRINMELPSPYRDRVKKLQEELGASSQSEVFRVAIGFLEELVKAKNNGNKLASIQEDGTTELFILIR